MTDHLQFKGISDIGTTGFTNQMTVNLTNFLDWSFLGIGGFFNVDVALSGHYGGDQSRLRRVSDPRYIDGQVYEGFRSNWVYESGISYGIAPITYSGVYVNGSFYEASTTGVYSHSVDYPRGRVVFDTPISNANTIVKCGFSYKQVYVTDADEPFARTVMPDSFRVDSPQFLQQGSGIWNVLSENRVQLPAIIVNPMADVNFTGLELGGGDNRNQTVMLNVVAETATERNNLMDILLMQTEKSIYMYDVNQVIDADRFPLDINGYLQPSGYLYPGMIDNFRKWRLTILETRALDIFNDRNIYRAAVQWQCEVPINNDV